MLKLLFIICCTFLLLIKAAPFDHIDDTFEEFGIGADILHTFKPIITDNEDSKAEVSNCFFFDLVDFY